MKTCGKTYAKHLLDRLNLDAEFQRRIRDDAKLKELLAARESGPEIERDEILTILGGNVFVGNFAFRPPTLGSVASLSLIKSPFICGGTIHGFDVDVALRVFIMGRHCFDGIKSDLREIEALSLGLHEKLEMSIEVAHSAVAKSLEVAFSAFDMIPRQSNGDRENQFDADWLTWIVSAVSNVVHVSPRYIIWRMPMAETGYYVAQYLRRIGVKGIRHMPPGEALFGRLNELMDERLKELGAA